MKLVSWLESIRRSLVPNRRRAACSPIGRIEKLEDRTLLSNAPVLHLLKDINPGGATFASEFTESNGIVFFPAQDGIRGIELWRTDGTNGGTYMVTDINNDAAQSSSPQSLLDVNGMLYFRAFTSAEGVELWRSDGTAEGTTMVTDIKPGGGGPSSSPDHLTNVNGTLFFRADNGSHGQELWKVDGPTSAASLVKDIRSGSASSSPYALAAFQDTLFFRAYDDSSGDELWKSDGTPHGTVLVKDIEAGSGNSAPGFLTVVGDTLYFSAFTTGVGNELWRSDGTAAGTSLVTDICPASCSSNPSNLVDVDGLLYFSASDGTNGTELWKSDGTPGGTSMVKDISSGSSSSTPQELTAVDGTVFFSADDDDTRKLFKSDGTANGTVSVHPYEPDSLTTFGKSILFRASKSLYLSDGTPNQAITSGPGMASAGEPYLRAFGHQAFVNADPMGNAYLLSRYDYGDAPQSYGTMFAQDGARHIVTSSLSLGSLIDEEFEAFSSDSANGDGADDDGVVFLSPLNRGNMATVLVTASEVGRLDAWVDFNSDGDWDDFGEQLFDSTVLSAGDNTLSFQVVPWAIPNDETFARFRISAAGGLPPTGSAPDGEVEDHPVAINSAPHAATDRYEYVLPTLAYSTNASTGVLGNDWDPEGHDMDVTDILRDPVHGELSWSADGSFTYTYPGGAGDINDSWVYEVTDEDGGIDTGTVTIYVGPVNEFPTLDAITDPANVDDDAAQQTVSLSGITAGTGESQTLRVTAVSDNTDVLANPTVTYSSADTTASLAYTPIDNEFGQATVTVTVTDAGHNGAFDDFDDASVVRTFTVTVANAPTLAAINDPAAIDEDDGLQTVNLTGISPGDGETGPVSIAVVSDNTGLIPNPAINHSSGNSTGTLTYTPVGDASGSALVTVSVRNEGQDGQLGTDDDGLVEQSFTVIVNAVNDVPTLDATADPGAIDEDSAQQTINLTGIAAGGGENQVLSVTAVSSNHSLLADPTVTYTSADSTATLAYTPLADQFGTADITVTVRDAGLDAVAGNGDDGVTTDTFSVDVTSVNELPTLDAIADVVLAEGTEVYSVDLTGISAGGGESQVLTVTAVSSNIARIPHPSVTYTSADPIGSIAFVPVEGKTGSIDITVTVRDPGDDGQAGTFDDGTFTRTFTVTISDDPTVDAIPEPDPIDEDSGSQTVNFTGITAGGDGPQNLSVTATSDTPSLIPHPSVSYTSGDSDGSLTYTPSGDQSGTAVMTVTVTDGGDDDNLATTGDNRTTTADFTVTVLPVNDAPAVTIGQEKNIVENSSGGTVVGTVEVSDIDTNSADFTFDVVGGDPNGLFEIDNSGEITVATGADLDFESTTTHYLSVQVNDNDSELPGSDIETVQINIQDAAEAINISSSADHWSTGVSLVLVGDQLHVRKTGTTTDIVTPHVLSNVTSIVLDAEDGAGSQLTVDFANGNPIPSSGGVVVDGGDSDSNELVLTGGAATSVGLDVSGLDAGVVDVDGRTITFAQFSQVTDVLTADDRSYTFGDRADEILLSDDTNRGSGFSVVSAETVSVDFANPGTSLTVNSGGGDDHIDASDSSVATTFNGGAGFDVIIGTSASDHLLGGSRNDVLDGGAGDDTINGQAGFDWLFGGPGNDTLSGGDSDDTVSGEDGNDSILGGDGFDRLVGGIGDDTIEGESGNDVISGGDGLDSMIGGEGDDTVEGQTGDDTVLGGPGDDRLLGGSGNDLMESEGGEDTFLGGTGNDTIRGGADNDELYGQDGDDLLFGEENNDLLSGGAGDDTLNSGSGNDTVNGNEGADQIVGDDENVVVTVDLSDAAAAGSTFEILADGDEVLIRQQGGAELSRGTIGQLSQLVVRGTANDDTVLVDFSGGSPLPSGGLFVDASVGGGSDRLEILGAGVGSVAHTFDSSTTGTVTVDGRPIDHSGIASLHDEATATTRSFTVGDGDDVITLTDDGTSADGISRVSLSAFSGTIDFAGPTSQLAISTGDGSDTVTISGLDSAVSTTSMLINGQNDSDILDASGSAIPVKINGSGGDDVLIGGTAADTLNGGSGMDALTGGEGNDRLQGQGSSYDTLTGGLGDDTLDGGDGYDRISETADVDFTATDSSLVGLGSDTLINIQLVQLFGGSSANTIDASAFTGRAFLNGSGGNDTLTGGGWYDRIFGGSGRDLITGGASVIDPGPGTYTYDVLRGQGGNYDTLIGGDGADKLNGGIGHDSLVGAGGDDVLTGESGNDTIDGGAGTDRLYERGNVNMTLTDSGLSGGLGSDGVTSIETAYLKGGNGNNKLDASSFSGDVTMIGVGGDDTLKGGAGNDMLNGRSGDDSITGGDGDDTLQGMRGADVLNGGVGNDWLDGGTQDDKLSGWTGDDELYGRSENDILVGGDGNDSLYGAAGDDILQGDDGKADTDHTRDDDRLDGGADNDTVRGGGGGDTKLDDASEVDENFAYWAEWVDAV